MENIIIPFPYKSTTIFNLIRINDNFSPSLIQIEAEESLIPINQQIPTLNIEGKDLLSIGDYFFSYQALSTCQAFFFSPSSESRPLRL